MNQENQNFDGPMNDEQRILSGIRERFLEGPSPKLEQSKLSGEMAKQEQAGISLAQQDFGLWEDGINKALKNGVNETSRKLTTQYSNTGDKYNSTYNAVFSAYMEELRRIIGSEFIGPDFKMTGGYKDGENDYPYLTIKW